MVKPSKVMIAVAAAPVLIAGAVATAALATPSSGSHKTTALTAHEASVTGTHLSRPAGAMQGRRAPSGAAAKRSTATSSATGTLKAGSVLAPGNILYSPNHKYGLVMQTDGNLVLYNQAKQWLWSSQTSSKGAEAAFQTDGNLVVYSTAKKALWASGTKATASAVLEMGNTGDLVIKSSASGAELWSSQINLSALTTNEVLAPGHVLYSPSHAYIVAMQTDGNLVVYHGKQWLWSAETGGHPGAYAAYQGDGNLVVYSPSNKPLWASGTSAGAGSFAAIQNDGNFVIYASQGGAALWSSMQALSDLLPDWLLQPGHYLYSPNHKYVFVMQYDGNLVLYNSAKKALWASNTKSPGARATYQADGNFVVYSTAKKALWASGTKAGPGSFLTVQNDGNVVIYATPTGHAIWATNT
jgi:DNA-binding beta-propeller fold protein YncE